MSILMRGTRSIDWLAYIMMIDLRNHIYQRPFNLLMYEMRDPVKEMTDMLNFSVLFLL